MLLTNLKSEKFSPSDLKQLYSLRWGIETSFRSLKYTLGLLHFHSKKTEYIIQEIFAKLIMYNFTELIISTIIIKQKKRKHNYKVNFSSSVHICRNFLLKNISPLDVEALISSHILPVRLEISNPRGAPSAKRASSFLYRVS
ncbi:MAG: transposase [Clostridia bacterium]|nr:transposase [Clostridia bacterium]